MPRDWPRLLDPEPSARQQRWHRLELIVVTIALAIALLAAAPAWSKRKGGSVKRVRPVAVRTLSSAGVSYRSCAAARAAGAAPVRRGDAGYSRRLDRDGDGVGCE